MYTHLQTFAFRVSSSPTLCARFWESGRNWKIQRKPMGTLGEHEKFWIDSKLSSGSCHGCYLLHHSAVTSHINANFKFHICLSNSCRIPEIYCLYLQFACNNSTTTSGFLFHFAVPLSCSEGFTELGYYNGTVSQTDSGSPCLKWTEFPDYVQQYPGRGLGEHNYCRNPDRESNPWCFFRQSSGAIGWAYCDCHQGKTDCLAPSPHSIIMMQQYSFSYALHPPACPKNIATF